MRAVPPLRAAAAGLRPCVVSLRARLRCVFLLRRVYIDWCTTGRDYIYTQYPGILLSRYQRSCAFVEASYRGTNQPTNPAPLNRSIAFLRLGTGEL